MSELGLDDNFLIRKDLLLRFFVITNKVKPVYVGIIIVVLALLMVPWAVVTGVWKGIDYPLSRSYTTYIGDCLFGWLVVVICKYYRLVPAAFNKLFKMGILSPGSMSISEIRECICNIYSVDRYYVPYFVSLITTSALHFSFLRDRFWGWTEVSATGGFSFLGYYHILYFFFVFSVILNFFVLLFCGVRLARFIRKAVSNGWISYNFYLFCRYNAGGLSSITDVAMRSNAVLFIIGIYLAIVAITSLTFKQIGVDYCTWQIIETVLPIPIYLLVSPLLFVFQLYPIHLMMIDKNLNP